jgi:predicted GIY-YIG superfamily endonuclease
MRTTTFIYTLSCPISGDVRYVGKSNDPKGRFSEHRRMRGNNHLKNNWIKELLDQNLRPVLTTIDEILISEWKEKEKFYISKFTDLGCDLLNICGGANGLSFGNQTSFDGSQARKVICLFKDGTLYKTFSSMKESILSHGSSVKSVLYKLTKTAHGYIWIFEDEYKKLSVDELKTIVKNANNNMSNLSWKNGLINYQFKKGNIPLNTKKVYQYTKDNVFIKTWDSVMEATMSICGKKKSHISMAAAGTRKTAMGFKWSYNFL